MAFHEVQFPPQISYGSRGGPGFSTSIVEGEGGGRQAVSRWPGAKSRHNVRWGVKSRAQLTQVLDFWRARMGPAIGFRYKFWLDFTTASDHRSAHAPGDVLLGTVTTAPAQQFQLRTAYPDGSGNWIYRNIEKPVAGTVRIGRTPSGGGSLVELVNPTNFTVNSTTGLANITSGLFNGDTITAGFEYDEAGQFGQVDEEALQASLDDFDTGAIPDIPIVERGGNTSSPERFYAGSGTFQTLARLSVDFSNRVWVYGGSTQAFWLLPDPTDLELGGPYFHVLNNSAQTINLRTYDNVSLVGTIATGAGKFLVVYPDVSGVNKWGLA